jgi:hypothetical protein
LHSLFCNTFTHLHITMAFASMKQDCPHNCIWFIGHCHDQMFYLLQMANVSQKVNRASIVFHYCRILKRELINQNSAGLHPLGMHSYKLIEEKQK